MPRDIPEDMPQPRYVPLVGVVPDTSLQLLVQLMVTDTGEITAAHAAVRSHTWDTWSPPTELRAAP